jgi:hypothetical protein
MVDGPWTMANYGMISHCGYGSWTIDHARWNFGHGPSTMDYGPSTMDKIPVNYEQFFLFLKADAHHNQPYA